MSPRVSQDPEARAARVSAVRAGEYARVLRPASRVVHVYKLSPDEFERVRHAAADAGQTVSAWARAALLEALP